MDERVVLFHPTPMLLNETPLDEVAMPTRIRNAFKCQGLKTVGDVREASDATLLSFQDFGRGSLTFCREMFGPLKE
jgi:DNA-directed RNA polymerase alpha subunit